MTNSLNNGNYSRLSVDPTLGGMVDEVDFPHSGLFKALGVGVQGNYAILNAATSSTTENFSIVQTDTGVDGDNRTTQFVVGSGMVMRDGKAILVPTGSGTTTFNTGTPVHFNPPTSAGNGYFLLVVQADNTLAIRHNSNRTASNIVPQLTAGDIPIAMIRLAYAESGDSRQIQYFTTAKKENSLSIGYEDSNAYTEAMAVSGDGTRTTFQNKVANADIRFVLSDNTADEVFEVVTDDDADGDLSDTVSTVFAVKGDGSFVGLPINTVSSGADSRVAVFTGADGLDASTGLTYDGSTLGVTGNVGIGTSSPSEMLHLASSAAASPTILIENTGTDANEPELIFLRSATPSSSSLDIGHIKWKGKDDGGNVHSYASIFADMLDETGGTEDGRMLFSLARAGTDLVEYMRMGGSEVSINEGQIDIDFRVEGGTKTHAFFVQGSSGNVGIGNTSPSATLHIQSSSASTAQILIESTESGSSAAPDVVFLRDSPSPANGDDLGHLKFMGKSNDNGVLSTFTYADIFTEAQTVTTGSEDGKLHIRTAKNNTMDKRISLDAQSTTINEDSKDVDFRVEGNGDAELLVCDAGEDKVGIGVTPTSAHTSKLSLEGSMMFKEQAAATADLASYGQLWVKDATPNQLYFTNDAGNDIRLDEEVFVISLSDETTDLAVGDGKAYFNMPFAMTLTAVKANVNMAPSGATIIVDIEEAGSSILTTKLSIDAGEKTSLTAASAAVIGGAGPALANDAEIKFNIDQVGSTDTGRGLKITLYGYRT